MENQRTIKTILSLYTGAEIEADSLFENQVQREAEIFQLRTKIEGQIKKGTIEYVCYFCKQPVAIRGRRNLRTRSTHYYFTHPYKSDECPIKIGSRYTEEEVRCIKYNGEKESQLHIELKNKIAYFLNLDKNVHVHVEKVYKDRAISKKWRKPDVLAFFPDKKVAFELQLTTTFLSVIVGRTIFYKERSVFLIWIFPDFSLVNDLQKFTQKDVYYNNNFNVYIFDASARIQSEVEKELVLKCYYKEFTDAGYGVKEKWVEKFIKISDLTFDYFNTTCYYYDSAAQKQRILAAIEERKIEKRRDEKVSKTKERVDKSLQILRGYYKKNVLPPFIEENFLDELETEEEVELLNNPLKFSTDNSSVISKLFFKRDKVNFLRFICTQDKIAIDTSKVSYKNKTILEELLSIDIYNFRFYTSLLFRKGYSLTIEDRAILDSLYKSKSSIEGLEKWAFIHYLSSITKKEYAIQIERIARDILNPILSLERGFVIGANYKFLKQVCINFMEYRKQFGELFINAMKIYNHYDILLYEDKKGTLKAKIDRFYDEAPEQDSQYNEIIFDIFPELRE